MHIAHDAGGPALRLNVLDSGWARSTMTGGPNTVINLAARIAREGVPVRLVSTIDPVTLDPVWLRGHVAELIGATPSEMTIASAGHSDRPLDVGAGDVFLATHWTTALQLKGVLPLLANKTFFYMLQEFEAGFYAWSSNYARVVETYGMDFWPIVNEALLAEFLFSQPLGRLSDPVMRERAVVFEPAVDSSLFYPAADASPRPRRLLFYARPTNTRNMFGLGLLALREVAADPAFAGWEFLAIGGRGAVPDMDLGAGRTLRPAPWASYGGYGDLLRDADILLCPMLSPHTSYPVLEMPACGGLSVTNTFSTKTAERLAAISPQIIACEPTVPGLAEGLRHAAKLVGEGRGQDASLNVLRDWGSALDSAARRIVDIARGAAASIDRHVL